MAEEVHRPDTVLLKNVDLACRAPMTVLPAGAQMETDCAVPGIEIFESGVSS